MSDWFKPMPIYVTRKDAGGTVGSLSMGIIWVLLMVLLVFINLIGWSIYGIIELVDKL